MFNQRSDVLTLARGTASEQQGKGHEPSLSNLKITVFVLKPPGDNKYFLAERLAVRMDDVIWRCRVHHMASKDKTNQQQ